MSRLGAFAAVMVLFAGCGGESNWRNRPIPPFMLGAHVGDGPASPPNIEILQPVSSTRLVLQPRDRMPCQVRLTYPGSGTLPTFLTAVFRRGRENGDAGSVALDPQEKNGSSFTFGCQLKAPANPGRYRLQIEIVETPEESQSGGRPQPTASRPVTTMKVADIEVRRRK